jgi:hypothetical protein
MPQAHTIPKRSCFFMVYTCYFMAQHQRHSATFYDTASLHVCHVWLVVLEDPMRTWAPEAHLAIRQGWNTPKALPHQRRHNLII